MPNKLPAIPDLLAEIDVAIEAAHIARANADAIYQAQLSALYVARELIATTKRSLTRLTVRTEAEAAEVLRMSEYKLAGLRRKGKVFFHACDTLYFYTDEDLERTLETLARKPVVVAHATHATATSSRGNKAA